MEAMHWRAHRDVATSRCGEVVIAWLYRVYTMQCIAWSNALRGERGVATSRGCEASIAWLCRVHHAMYRRYALPWSNALSAERIATSRRCALLSMHCFMAMHISHAMHGSSPPLQCTGPPHANAYLLYIAWCILHNHAMHASPHRDVATSRCALQ